MDPPCWWALDQARFGIFGELISTLVCEGGWSPSRHRLESRGCAGAASLLVWALAFPCQQDAGGKPGWESGGVWGPVP